MRSLLWLKLWSMRAVHWIPSRGSVWANDPLSVTGKLHGSAPIGVSMAVDPLQSAPIRSPAVWFTDLATKMSGKSAIIVLDRLLG